MNVLLLMGVATDGGWLQLVLPIWIIVGVVYMINYVVLFIKKKWKQRWENPINDHPAPIDNTDQDLI